MALEVSSLFATLRLNNQLGGALQSARSDLASFAGTAQSQIGNVISGFKQLAAAAGLAFAAGKAIEGAIAYDEALTNIRSVTGDTAEATAALGKEIGVMGRNSRYGGLEAAKAYYDIAGAVGDVTARMPLLQSAIATAEAGNANLASTTKALITIVNGFGWGAEGAARASDILTRTVQVGVGTMDEFAAAFAPVVPAMKAAGVSAEEFASLSALLTTKGISASMSTNSLQAAVTALLTPNKALQDVLGKVLVDTENFTTATRLSGNALAQKQAAVGDAQRAIDRYNKTIAEGKQPTEAQVKAYQKATAALPGLQSALAGANDKVKIFGKLSMEQAISKYGLAGVLERVAKAAGGSKEKIAQMLGSVEAARAAFALMGSDFDSFNANFQEGLKGSTATAQEIQNQSVQAKLDKFKSQLEGVAQSLGAMALPVLSVGLDLVTTVTASLNDALGNLANLLGVGGGDKKKATVTVDAAETLINVLGDRRMTPSQQLEALAAAGFPASTTLKGLVDMGLLSSSDLDKLVRGGLSPDATLTEVVNSEVGADATLAQVLGASLNLSPDAAGLYAQGITMHEGLRTALTAGLKPNELLAELKAQGLKPTDRLGKLAEDGLIPGSVLQELYSQGLKPYSTLRDLAVVGARPNVDLAALINNGLQPSIDWSEMQLGGSTALMEVLTGGLKPSEALALIKEAGLKPSDNLSTLLNKNLVADPIIQKLYESGLGPNTTIQQLIANGVKLKEEDATLLSGGVDVKLGEEDRTLIQNLINLRTGGGGNTMAGGPTKNLDQYEVAPTISADPGLSGKIRELFLANFDTKITPDQLLTELATLGVAPSDSFRSLADKGLIDPSFLTKLTAAGVDVGETIGKQMAKAALEYEDVHRVFRENPMTGDGKKSAGPGVAGGRSAGLFLTPEQMKQAADDLDKTKNSTDGLKGALDTLLINLQAQWPGVFGAGGLVEKTWLGTFNPEGPLGTALQSVLGEGGLMTTLVTTAGDTLSKLGDKTAEVGQATADGFKGLLPIMVAPFVEATKAIGKLLMAAGKSGTQYGALGAIGADLVAAANSIQFRYKGGHLQAGRVYGVAEREAEIIMPQRSGYALPVSALGGGSAVSNNTFHITLNGVNDPVKLFDAIEAERRRRNL